MRKLRKYRMNCTQAMVAQFIAGLSADVQEQWIVVLQLT
jgi:hypothetical protein